MASLARKNQTSIQKTFLLFLLTFVIIQIFIAFFMLILVPMTIKDFLKNRTSALIRSVSINLESYCVDKILALKNLNRQIRSMQSSYDTNNEVNSQLEIFVESYSFFSGLILLNDEGRMVASSRKFKDLIGFDYSKYDFFIKPYKTKKSCISSKLCL